MCIRDRYKTSGLKALAGGYILSDCKGTPDVLLISTGSEVDLCAGAKEILEGEGLKVRLVSMPSMEEFEKQTPEYREYVLPKAVKARVCVEAASHYAWYKYCLLYTSDAADDRISVDLGGRRIIKKIFFKQKTAYEIRLSLVGSEMCIRDRFTGFCIVAKNDVPVIAGKGIGKGPVSYTHLTLPTIA